MKYKWLNKNFNSKLIIFFNGWGMDECVVSRLGFGEYDVLMFYDYNSLKTDFNFNELDRYPEKNLVAWSMGVMCATLFDIKYNKKIAINGTPFPIDNQFGIPEKIYNLTVKGFNEKNSAKFIQNMFNGVNYLLNLSRDIENQKSELVALKNYAANAEFKYDKVLISSDDRIIPTKNQCAFWNIEPNIKSGHFPFHLFKTWSDIL